MTSHIVFDYSHMDDSWVWLEIFAWNMMDEELRYDLHWGIPFLSVVDILDDVIYTKAYPTHRW